MFGNLEEVVYMHHKPNLNMFVFWTKPFIGLKAQNLILFLSSYVDILISGNYQLLIEKFVPESKITYSLKYLGTPFFFPE